MPTKRVFAARSILFTVFHHPRKKSARTETQRESKYSLLHLMLISTYFLYSVHDARARSHTAVAVTALNSHWLETCPKLNCINSGTNINSKKRKNPYNICCYQMRPAVPVTIHQNNRSVSIYFFARTIARYTSCDTFVGFIFVYFSACIICASYVTTVPWHGLSPMKSILKIREHRQQNYIYIAIAIVFVENGRRLQPVWERELEAVLPWEKVLYN